MNYDHAFHAGNHADVLKHLVLVALLEALRRKPAPFFVLDTHAGQGRYALDTDATRRSGEAQTGILRLQSWQARQTQVAPALQNYLQALVPHLAADNYPGSPQLIIDALRQDDRLACCELKPETARTLKSHLGRDPRIAVHVRDGYEAVKALLPPTPRRGMVLIDPPYEAQLDEFKPIIQALKEGLTRWPQGIFALWYPIKRHRDLQPFLRKAGALPAQSILAAELVVHPGESPLRLNGSGMLVFNPPWQLDTALKPAMTQLAEALADADGQWHLDWLRPAA